MKNFIRSEHIRNADINKLRIIFDIFLKLKIIILLCFVIKLSTYSKENKLSDGNIIEETKIYLGDSDFDKNLETTKIIYMSDGLKVIGFIIKPKDITKKYPAIIYNRGGNREFGKITIPNLRTLAQIVLKYNYIILASQYRGNDGSEGREEFGGGDVNDIINLIKVTDHLSYIKKDEIFMLGESRGGMMTYLAIKKGAPIKSAVINCGISNLFDTYHERKQGMKDVMIELIGGTPEEKFEEYASRSAYYWPEKINVPVLILAGGKDWRVSVNQSKKMADILKKNNKIVNLIVYPDGKHCLPRKRNDWIKKTIDWFEKYK